ncbi:hypothetical protein D7X30_22625 [Corallococcus sp. AB011P]|uniref:hypothetical protein n=1 Tax=Corallococcus sp. AB011P TaxID=2316735 RepID=UPI000EA22F6A|nr:hypothetical protein [Corallococcus sp. AB011P]RKG56379.1 hypothetical protein D7X30_22625 [Corallococcus sp. AB011P]
MTDSKRGDDSTRYFIVGNRTVKWVPLEDGGLQILKLDWATGLFIPGVDSMHKCLWADDSERVSEDEFIQQTEDMRRELFTGDNEVFALYGLLDTIDATAKAEGRPLTEQERAIVILTQRKTHAMFESVCRLGENYTRKKPY